MSETIFSYLVILENFPNDTSYKTKCRLPFSGHSSGVVHSLFVALTSGCQKGITMLFFSFLPFFDIHPYISVH